jgi:hypothetical protein
LVVGDSALAGVRWYEGAAERLRGARFVLDAESCRRTAVPSCGGREERIPMSATERIIAAPPGEFDTLVLMMGYNDDGGRFEEALAAVDDAARSVGIDNVVVLTLSTPDPLRSPIRTEVHNAALARFRPRSDRSNWVVADWAAYSAPWAAAWFESDRIHLTSAGAYALADYVSALVAHATAHACPGGGDSPCRIPTSPPIGAEFDYAAAPRVRCLEVGADREVVCEPVG